MNVPRSFNRLVPSWRTLHKALTICVLVSLVSGLIPPPLVRSALPTSVADLAEALLPQPEVALAAGAISGVVFRDFNSDGQLTANGTITDTGVADVTVTIYDAAGTAQGNDTTDSTDAYSISATGTGPYRVEFTTLPAGYFPSFHSSHSGSNTTAPNSAATTAGTTVQFVPDGNSSNVNLAINAPEDYS